MKEMFMRFYGTTEDQVDKCLVELNPFMQAVVQVDVGPLEDSMNVFIPAEGNFEVNLVFCSENALSEYRSLRAAIEIYMKYAAPGITGAEFSVRKQGDPVWNHT